MIPTELGNEWLVSLGSNPLFDRCVGTVSILLHHIDAGVTMS
jgi:hypothetical protein